MSNLSTQYSPIYTNITTKKFLIETVTTIIHLINTISPRYYHFNYRLNQCKDIICPPTSPQTSFSISSFSYITGTFAFSARKFSSDEPFLCISPTLRQLLPGFRIHANLVFLSFSVSLSFRGGSFGGGIGWIRGKQCCGRHRFAAVLTTHFRASSFRGMYFLQRYRPSCCCSRAVSASDATVSGLSDFDEANVGEWQTSNCIFDYVDSMLRKPRCISRQAVEFLNLLRCLERTRLKFFFFQRITLRIVFLSFEFFEFIK